MSPETTPHLGDLQARRLRAGELSAAEASAARAHAAACAACAGRLDAAEAEQRAFEAAVPFAAFEAGVQRAARRTARPRMPTRLVGLALAASLAVVGVWAAQQARGGAEDARRNRIKGGGVEAELRVGGGAGPQRVAAADVAEPLAPGERVRVGVRVERAGHLAVASVDAAGEVTLLYPEAGAALPVAPSPALQYLAGSVEFTGAGAETVVLVVREAPFDAEELRRALRAAWDAAGGDAARLGPVALEGAQVRWVVHKP